MWSKLLHTATGHVQKLNDCKESERQANGTGSARQHSEGSYVDMHTVYLVTFATSSWLIIGLFSFFLFFCFACGLVILSKKQRGNKRERAK